MKKMMILILIPLCLGLSACDKDNFVAQWVMDGQKPVAEETEVIKPKPMPEPSFRDRLDKKIVGTWGEVWYCQSGETVRFDSNKRYQSRLRDVDGIESTSPYDREDGVWTVDGDQLTLVLNPTETDGSDGRAVVLEADAQVIDGRLILDFHGGYKVVYYDCARNWW